MNIFTRYALGLLLLSGLAGCASWYQPAEIEGAVISNPTVGWAGYSITIPEGLELIDPRPGAEPSEEAKGFGNWYDRRGKHWSGDYSNTFTERFILKNPERTFTIIFLSETYELPAGWSALDSTRANFIVNKMINRKKVVINDDHAFSRQVEVNGQRGWFISGAVRSYSKKDAKESEYEGCYLLGGLKEAYWVEGFGQAGTREEMRTLVGEMIQSLEINEVSK